jgi:hypothetical protein
MHPCNAGLPFRSKLSAVFNLFLSSSHMKYFTLGGARSSHIVLKCGSWIPGLLHMR